MPRQPAEPIYTYKHIHNLKANDEKPNNSSNNYFNRYSGHAPGANNTM